MPLKLEHHPFFCYLTHAEINSKEEKGASQRRVVLSLGSTDPIMVSVLQTRHMGSTAHTHCSPGLPYLPDHFAHAEPLPRIPSLHSFNTTSVDHTKNSNAWTAKNSNSYSLDIASRQELSVYTKVQSA
jgi:hypothetical protein